MADACEIIREIILCVPKISLLRSEKQTNRAWALSPPWSWEQPVNQTEMTPACFLFLFGVRWLNHTATLCSIAEMKLQSMTGDSFLFNSGHSVLSTRPELRAWPSLQFPLRPIVSLLESVANFSCKDMIQCLPLFHTSMECGLRKHSWDMELCKFYACSRQILNIVFCVNLESFSSFCNIFGNHSAREIRIGLSTQQCNPDTWETSSFSLNALRLSNDNVQPGPIWSQWKAPSWVRLGSEKGPESKFPVPSAHLSHQPVPRAFRVLGRTK